MSLLGWLFALPHSRSLSSSSSFILLSRGRLLSSPISSALSCVLSSFPALSLSLFRGYRFTSLAAWSFPFFSRRQLYRLFLSIPRVILARRKNQPPSYCHLQLYLVVYCNNHIFWSALQRITICRLFCRNLPVQVINLINFIILDADRNLFERKLIEHDITIIFSVYSLSVAFDNDFVGDE